MSTAQLVIVCATVLLAVFLASAAGAVVSLLSLYHAGDGGEPAPGTDTLPHEGAVVVHTRDGRSLQGTVVSHTPGAIVLADAALLVGGQSQPVGGEVRIPTENESFSQRL